ncbi:hypothetical protein [Leucobacter sp. W1153]|uniref:hypothetical protein n=1 Tax=unclassified Leucobacter TaxID=2621730 RepID=UPI003F345CC5
MRNEIILLRLPITLIVVFADFCDPLWNQTVLPRETVRSMIASQVNSAAELLG